MPRRAFILICCFSVAIVALWAFPFAWYTYTEPGKDYLWLAEQTNVVGWSWEGIPVAESAEKVLVADRLVNGEFKDAKGRMVRVFSAKRYKEKQNEIGLFIHTPDRCWTEAGWKLEAVAPDVVELDIHGVRMLCERRIFVAGTQRELVYFCGLTGGQPLPYRLDHNLSVGMRYRINASQARSGAALRASDSKLWTRVWESFTSRRPLLGPKQFIRISIPVTGADLPEADAVLERLLKQWLVRTDYRAELATWKGQ